MAGAMLRELSIRNLAVVEEAVVPFVAGLNVLTGETGAGKSIVVDALLLLTGAGLFIRSLQNLGKIDLGYDRARLVLLGANLPHCWKTTPSVTGEHSTSVVIQFRHDFMGDNFFSRPELRLVERMLTNSKYGIQFKGLTRPVQEKMKQLLLEDNSMKKLITLLDILHTLTAWPDYMLLDRQEVFPGLSDPEKERMNAIIAYIVENFQREISLQKAASIANMTHYAFCRYFKRINRKTFMEVVIDYRIDFAMRQLIYTNKSISGIAFDCGFNDISNFHKTFKNRLHASPLHYRKQFTALTS